MGMYEFNRAADLVEKIADDLHNIARQSFDAAAARRDAERRMSHMIDTSRTTPQTNQMLNAEVARVQKESESALERQAFALVQQLPSAEEELSRTFEEVRPKRDISTTTAIMLSQERWEAAKAIIESGRSIETALEVADMASVLAIEAFAPDYLFAESRRSTLGNPGIDIADIKRSVDLQVRARIIELADGAAAEVMAKAHRANGFVEVAWEWANHLERRFQGRANDAMGTAVTVAYIRRDYGIDKTPRQERDEKQKALGDAASSKLRRVEHWAQRVGA